MEASFKWILNKSNPTAEQWWESKLKIEDACPKAAAEQFMKLLHEHAAWDLQIPGATGKRCRFELWRAQILKKNPAQDVSKATWLALKNPTAVHSRAKWQAKGAQLDAWCEVP